MHKIFGILLIIGTVAICIIGLSHAKSKNSDIIYSAISRDDWGGETTPEFKVKCTTTELTITEVKQNSVFFKEFVKDSTLNTITFHFNLEPESNEYAGRVQEYANRLCHFREPCDNAYIQVHSGMVRILIYHRRMSNPFVYRFYPSTTDN